MNVNELYGAIQAATAREDWTDGVLACRRLIIAITETGEIPGGMVEDIPYFLHEMQAECCITVLSFAMTVMRGRMKP